MLQHRPGGWEDAFVSHVGPKRAPQLIERLFEAEAPAVRGEVDVLDVVRPVLEEYGVTAATEDVYAEVWLQIDVPDTTHDLLGRLRGRGYGVHLGTNQSVLRAGYMRRVLGFDELFDISCYSAEIRVAKPDPAYFEAALGLIGAGADEVLFVDDNETNVDAARSVGMAGVHWHLSEGLEVLLERLAANGVDLRIAL